MSGDLAPRLLAFLATYAIHATLLLGLAALLARTLLRGARPREVLWRAALLGGVLTALLQTALGLPNAVARLPAPEARMASAPVQEVVARPTSRAPRPIPTAHASTVHERSASVPLEPARPGPGPLPWPEALLGAWALGVGWLLLRRRLAWRRLRQGLAAARPVEDVQLLGLLRELARSAGLGRTVALAASKQLASPLALDGRRPTIVVPTRALAELPPAELEAVLAHEVAHLARRDALWFRLQGLLAAVFFFQPLNHLAVRRLRDLAEVLCDDWAAREEHRREALASCLARVATWTLERRDTALVPGMAHRPGLLGVRVRRLLDADGTRERRPTRGARVLAAALLFAVLAFAPGVDRGVAGAPSPAGATATAPRALALLDQELAALEGEAAALQALLETEGHDDLARRLDARLDALRARRASLERAPDPDPSGEKR